MSRNFKARTQVIFTCANKIEAMYGRSRVSLKVEPRSTFTFTLDLSYVLPVLYYARKFSLSDSGNPPKGKNPFQSQS